MQALLKEAAFSIRITLMNKTNLPVWPVIAFVGLTLFVFGPGTVYLTNTVEFTNSYVELLLAGLVLALAFALVFRLLFLALQAVGPRFLEKGLALLFSLGFLAWLQGNFLLWNYGPLDGRLIDWPLLKTRGLIDGGIWIAVLVAALVFSSFVTRIARRLCLLLLLLQLGYGAILFFKQPETPSFQRYTVDIRNKFVFSGNRNLIMVILDSFQTDVFNEIIRENPGMAGDLDGFTYYRNALGGYPATELSVALMLTGRFYDNSQPFEQWKKEAYMAASIPRVLKANGWQVDIYPDVSYSLFYSDQIASNFVKGVPFAEKAMDLAQVHDINLFRFLPHYLKPYVYNDQGWLLQGICRRIIRGGKTRRIHNVRVTRPGSLKKLRNRVIFSRKAYRLSPVIRFFDQMLSDSSTTDTKGTFKFYHLMIPHIPLLLDENFDFKKMAVNRANYKAYATAAVKLMVIFLDHLQELGIYDDSLIVIVGDHGAGGQQQEFVIQPDMPATAAAPVVRDRSRISALPLILYKPPAAHGKLKVSDAPVSHGDLPATVFADLGLAVQVPGMPMHDIPPAAERQRRYLTYAGRDIFSFYGDMTEYIVSGYGWLDDSWRHSGRIFTRHGQTGKPR